MEPTVCFQDDCPFRPSLQPQCLAGSGTWKVLLCSSGHQAPCKPRTFPEKALGFLHTRKSPPISLVFMHNLTYLAPVCFLFFAPEPDEDIDLIPRSHGVPGGAPSVHDPQRQPFPSLTSHLNNSPDVGVLISVFPSRRRNGSLPSK